MGSANKSKKSKKGKTTQSNKDDAVAGTEAGGITQVISAFQVPLESQENAVTFLDTPGHAAFRAMRESGSNAADVIVLVVAADDGVSPQTVEIINFYKSIVKGAGGGGISMMVAMTKIDKHGIDVNESRQRIENQLLEHGILSESFGSSGDSEYGPPVQVVPVSGLTGEGLDDLIEGLVLQSEVMDLRADEKAQGEGIVMDARIEKGVGVVADCIVRWGSLERGSIIVSGIHSGKIKALKDSK
jgi:translation initiation factor IF-2